MRGSRLIARRYQLINELGQGGMGSVYRVLDRLTGNVVTLKMLNVTDGSDSGGPGASDARMALAQEFRLLASLRHPNIISVLDYGFDRDHQPFFTMNLRENALTIIEAGREKPLSVRVELLVQTLRALDYLHRHGILHRDLKPENIIVVDDQVKVLDLGLSIYREMAEAAGTEFAGTLGYVAPEILSGEGPTERGDLYALGMVAYELFTGGNPVEQEDWLALQRDIMETPLPRAGDDLDPRLRPILQQLLAKDPNERYRDAREVITALAVAVDEPLSAETVTTRESFLQAAPLVGRAHEIAQLTEVLRQARQRRGSAWVISGESGVGKSRLLDEIRILGLADAMVVARGQAKSQGGGPYHAWRDIISNLVLHTDLEEADAAVLKAIVPDISALLGQEVPDAPVVDSDAAQSRLLLSIEDLVRRQPGPVLVIVEDLQWVGSESLKTWNWLARAAPNLPLALLGSYRDDEAPDLPDKLRCTKRLALRRLHRGEIEKLAESMVGPSGRRPKLVEFLERETEGNPFFLVEVVRLLAERAGRLTRIGDSDLPQRVVSGDLQRLVRRRLKQVPSEARAPLETAAVVGKELNPRLMQTIHPDLVLGKWAATCAGAAVLDLRDQRWRFAHDKLREQLLEDLPTDSRKALHREIARAIERMYPDRDDQVTALAHHWGQAGEAAMEADYAHRAGVLQLASGACPEAIIHLERALELMQEAGVDPAQSEGTLAAAARTARRSRSLLDPNARADPDSLGFRIGVVEGALADAHYRLGDLKRARDHGERALFHFGQYVPTGRWGWLVGTLQQAGLRSLQATFRVRSRDLARARRVAREVAPVQIRMTETFFYSLQSLPLVWSSLRTVNQCEPAGPSPQLAQGYMMIGLMAPLPRFADAWCRRALEIAEQTGTRRDVALALSRIGVYHIGTCRWDEAEAEVRRATRIAEEIGDLRLLAECSAQTGAVALYGGRFERGHGQLREVQRLCLRSGNKQGECWGLLGEADCLVRMGRDEEALGLYEQAIGQLDEQADRSEVIWGLGMQALARLRIGDRRGAYESAEGALSLILETRPVAYWLQHSTAATAEVFLSLLESEWGGGGDFQRRLAIRAKQACAAIRRYARGFPLGRPHALLWQGLNAHLAGRRSRAMRLWRKSLGLAEALHTPYEQGRAHLEVGRHLAPEDKPRRHHLSRAAELFEKLGCARDLTRSRRELEATP